MAALLGLFTVLFFCGLCSSADEDPLITGRPGDNVTLPCRGLTSHPIALLDWTRPELKKDGFVFFYRHGKVYESYQHKLYRGRVALKDPQMTNGDVSVILKNVSGSDNGTYECFMFLDTGSGQKPQLKHIVTLEVKEIPEEKTETPYVSENLPLKVGLPVAVVLLLVSVSVLLVFMWFKKKSQQRPNEPTESETSTPLKHD